MGLATLRLAGLAGPLLVWEFTGRAGAFHGYLPPASAVLPQVISLLGNEKFLRDVVATVLSMAVGVGIATAIAVPVGVLLASRRLLRIASTPVLEFLRPIPPVAIVPLVVVAVGGGPETKIGLTVFAALWPILFHTMYAVAEVEPLLLDTARAFGFGPSRLVITVVLPHVAPFVLTGVRLSAAIGLSVVISVEMLTGTSGGIGAAILAASTGVTRMDLVLAGVVIAGIVGITVNTGLELVHRRWFAWHAEERELEA